MNDIQIFNNTEFGDVRTLTIDGEPYFVGKDVAEILGYENQNRDILRHVDEEDRVYLDEKTQYQNGIEFDSKELGQRGGWLINESGLYSLILSSKLPTAKKFKHWVTSEVLPAIRKHGMYAVDELLENPDIAIQAFTALKEERAKNKALQTENAMQKQIIAEYSPKASYYDVVLQTADALSVTQIAKDYGKSAKWLNEKLHEHGVQYKQGEVWLLYQKYAEAGYTRSKTHTYSGNDGKQHSKLHTYWTQKGRLFIYELLKKQNILPLMEQTSEPESEGRTA